MGLTFDDTEKRFVFDFEYDGTEDIVSLTGDGYQVEAFGKCFYYVYEFSEQLESSIRTTFIKYVKFTDELQDTPDLTSFIKKAVNNLEETPAKEGHTFSDWSETPEIMPTHDVIVLGSFVLQGDANVDGIVDAADIVEMVNYTKGHPSANFNKTAADMNGDNEIDDKDIEKVVKIIMRKE